MELSRAEFHFFEIFRKKALFANFKKVLVPIGGCLQDDKKIPEQARDDILSSITNDQ